MTYVLVTRDVSYNRSMDLLAAQELLLKRYVEAVMDAPQHLHLTADRNPKEFWLRHVQDAILLHDLIPAEYRKPRARVLDVGSGNGVPGIPLAIVEPQWGVELLDSDTKKCGFLDTFCKKYAIRNVRVIVGRAEVLGQGALRDCYDIVFARALSKLPVALELSAAFVTLGGILIVPHGTSWDAELKDSLEAVESLGLMLLGSEEYTLQGVGFRAIMLRKDSPTPDMYPRSPGKPEKDPL